MILVPDNSNPQHGELLLKRGPARLINGFVNPYIYDPSLPVAVGGAVVFSLVSAYLVYQHFRYRSWFFWAVLIGVAMEVTGFICRAVSATDELRDVPFLIAFLMILLAPSLLAAACYTAFSRVVWFSCPTNALSFKHLWFFPSWITPTFVAFDLLSFLIQVIGASQISRAYDQDNGKDRSIEAIERKVIEGRIVLVLGLILQMSCFASFAVIAIRYFLISRSWRADDLGDWKLWRKLCWMINVAATLIALRAMYRTLEIPHDKYTGLRYLQRHEWCFWTFDAAPILITLLVFAVFHPGRYLPRSYTGMTLDKKKALQQKEEIAATGVWGQIELEPRPSSMDDTPEFSPEDFPSKMQDRDGMA